MSKYFPDKLRTAQTLPTLGRCRRGKVNKKFHHFHFDWFPAGSDYKKWHQEMAERGQARIGHKL